MNYELLTIQLPSELKAKLERLCKTARRSESSMVAQAIGQYLDENAWQIEELIQAKKEIEHGEFISNDEVKRYLNSWGSGNELPAPRLK